MKIRFLLIGTSLSLIPSLTSAQCVATQDCATLGYTETSCSGGSGVKCPFGNKWACFKSESEYEQQFCDKYGFTNACTGTGYSGGLGKTCNGKYAVCTCTSGYEWRDGICQKQILNGAQGDLYYCNGTVVGVKASSMNFYIALKDVGQLNWDNANSLCQSYVFCNNIKGTLPTQDQLATIYNNKSQITGLLLTNGGTELTNNYYWSSTRSGQYFVIDMSDGRGGWYSSYFNHYARPILTSW